MRGESGGVRSAKLVSRAGVGGRMSAFRPFERDIVEVLVRPHLTPERLAAVLDSAELVSCEHTGSGYYLTVRHPGLPAGRIVCHHPVVIGRCGDVQCGFVAFIEDAQLTLECHSWGPVDVPDDFRERQVGFRIAG